MVDSGTLAIVVLSLIVIGLVLVLAQGQKKTGESYPPETKQVLAIMVGAVVYLASRTSNTADDKAAEMLRGLVAGMGIDVPLVGKTEEKVGGVPNL